MKKKVWVILLFLCGCCLAGCQAVPEKVKEANKKYNDNEQIGEVEIHRCSVDGLEASIKEGLQIQPENMTLPKSVDFGSIREVDELVLEYQSDFLNKKEQAAELFGRTETDWKDLETTLKDNRTQVLSRDTGKYMVTVSDNGFVSAILPGVYDLFTKVDTTSFEKLYRVNRGDDTSDTCILNGEETTVSDEITYVNDWFQNSWKKQESEFDYKVKTVVLRRTDACDNILSMEISKSYQGIPLDTCGGLTDISGNQVTLKTIGAQACVALAEKDSIDYFTNGDGSFQVKNKTRQETFIDLSSAIRLAEKELSGFQALDISDIKIIYVLKPSYDSTEENANYAAPGNQVIARPTYSFLIDRQYKDIGIAGIDDSCLNYFINVDMISGEVTLNLDMAAYEEK